MNSDGSPNSTSFKDIGKEQGALARQLMQVATSLRHIDELFQWTANAFVQHFNVQLVQFWSNQINSEGRLAPQLRTIAQKDPSLPEQVAASTQMASLVQYVTNARRSYKAQPVESLFPSYQTILLKRYGLYHCGACFISKHVYLPPVERMFAYDQLPTPLTLAMLFFVRQAPPVELLSALNLTLEQVLTLAENSGLLTPIGFNGNMQQVPDYMPNMQTPGYLPNISQTPVTPLTPMPGYTPSPSQMPVMPPASMPDIPPPFEQLIPRRKQDADAMLSNNPFTSKAVISDKKARRLHGAIDGQTDIAGLCVITGLSIKEAHLALQLLLAQQYIEVYEPGGRLVKNFPFLREM